jgi:hypothetical protein
MSEAEQSSDSRVRKIRKQLELFLEKFIRYLFFWENDDRRVGIFLRSLHQIFIVSLVISYILVHFLFPSYFLLCIIWILSTLIWIFHLITGACVCTRIEQRLTGEKITIVDPLLELFHIPLTKENRSGITLLTSTIFFFCLSSELFCRTYINFKSFFGV